MPVYYSGTATAITFYSRTSAGAANTATTPTLKISKDWAAPSAAAGTLSHVGDGIWKYIPSAGEVSSVSVLHLIWTGTGLESSDLIVEYEASYTAARAGYLDNLNGLTLAAIWDRATSAITTAGSIGKLIKDNLDAAISSRLATSGYTAPNNVGIASADTYAQSASVSAALALSRMQAVFVSQLSLLQGSGSDVQVNDVLDGAVQTTALAGHVLRNARYNGTWKITSYNSGTGVIVAEPIAPNTATLRSIVDATVTADDGSITEWFVSLPPTLPDYPDSWPRIGTSAAIFLDILGASSGGCGCTSKKCGGDGGEARLYDGDTKERVFFLRDGSGSAVPLPTGVSVEVWDSTALVGAATVTVTDTARWSGVLSIPTALWSSLNPGTYWLRVLDGDDEIQAIQALTIIDPSGVGTGW